MADVNIELVRRLLDALNALDVEAFAALTTEDFEWSTSVMAVEGELFHGRQGIEAYFERIRDAWDRFVTTIDSSRDLGQRALISGHLEARGRGSGAPVVARIDILYDFKEGRIWRMHSFLDHEEALRAAGLDADV